METLFQKVEFDSCTCALFYLFLLRALTPTWEETLIYNESYSYFLQREQDDPPVIIFFEVYLLTKYHVQQII